MNKEIEKSPQLAEVKLSYKNEQPIEESPAITSPGSAEILLRQIWDKESIQLKEEFIVLLLNNAKKCLGWSKISSGGITSTIVDPVAIFQIALLANATSIILSHNHPSGNIEPSKSDKKLTQRIIKAGKILGITIDDHIIITNQNYFSFKANNIVW